MNNRDIYDQVASSILESLKEGVAPWRKSWTNSIPVLGTHKSIVTGQTYSGINAFVTTIVAEKKLYNSANWGTFKQWQGLGRSVAKDQKGTPVLFYKNLEVKNIDDELDLIPLAKRFYIFNEAQLAGYVPELANEFESITEADSILKNSPMAGISVTHGSPAYFPKLDLITMPDLNEFKEPEFYYGTLFHEMGHAAGSEKRLNRKTLTDLNKFGSHEYSKEELVAELTSAFLMAKSGLTANIPESASYCAGWLKVLNNDTNLFISAASQAQKAANYILGL